MKTEHVGQRQVMGLQSDMQTKKRFRKSPTLQSLTNTVYTPALHHIPAAAHSKSFVSATKTLKHHL